LFDKKKVVVKTLETLELKDISGRLTPVKSKMSDVIKGTSTTIIVETIEYDTPINENVFSEAWLLKGN
jgi:hypothetical protein